MVYRRPRAPKDKPDGDAAELLQWLCGKWQDHKASTYEVSFSENGAVLLKTTRPSGDVVQSEGLIRETADGVVWGRAGQRKVYTLEFESGNALRWKSSDEHGNAFIWRRTDPVSSDDDSAEEEQQRAARGERRAQLRREFQMCRENAHAINEIMELRKEGAVFEHPSPTTDGKDDNKKVIGNKVLQFLESPASTALCANGTNIHDFSLEYTIRGHVTRVCSRCSKPESPPPVMVSNARDLEQHWHQQQQHYQSLQVQWHLWASSQQQHYNYYSQAQATYQKYSSYSAVPEHMHSAPPAPPPSAMLALSPIPPSQQSCPLPIAAMQ